MKKIIKSLTIIIMLSTILFNFTGCYDAVGIEQFAYVIAMGLDISDDNQIELSLQFAKSGESQSSQSSGSSDSSQSSDTSITSVKCSSIDSGIALINAHISKQVNLSHCQEIIFSEKLAYNGITKFLDTLINNTELRTDCSVLVSKCDAKDYLSSVKPSLESLTARYYEYSLKSSEYTGYTVKVNLSDFYSDMKDSYSEAFAILGGLNTSASKPSSSVNGNFTAGNVPINDEDIIEALGIAVFKGDKLVGELTGLDSICHLIVSNQFKTCTLSIPNPFEENDFIDLRITSNKKTKCQVYEIGNSPLINLDVNLIAYGLSLNKDVNYDSEEAVEKITAYAEKYIKEQIENYLYKTARLYNSDISGLGKYAITQYLTLDDWEKAKWLDKYRYSFFNVNVDLNLKSGNIFNRT